MTAARRAIFFTFSYVILTLLAVPTAVKSIAMLTCRDDGNSIIGSRVLRDSAADRTTDKVVVFLHGVNGSGASTWLNQRQHAYWPKLMNEDPQFSHFDIYVANYPSPLVCPAPDITKIATNLRYDLRNNPRGEYSQIFVIAHSMGGLVAEQMITDLENDPVSLSKFKAIFFFGSPTQGASIASVAHLVSDNPQYAEMGTQSNGYLYLLGRKWGDLLEPKPNGPQPLHSYCAVESYRTDGLSVVPEYMAQFHCDEQSLPVYGNHIEMVKPASRDDLVYRNTARLILALSKNSAPQATRFKGHASLQDCWLDGPHCGFQFSTGKVVGQYADTLTADVVLMNQIDQTKTATDNPAMLFASNDSPPYVGDGNAGADAGIVEMSATSLDEVIEAPLSGYVPHWVPVKVGGVYCVRTRDALHFAKIKITGLTNKTTDFDWVYQPEASRDFPQ